jgi:hypothetical protein
MLRSLIFAAIPDGKPLRTFPGIALASAGNGAAASATKNGNRRVSEYDEGETDG